MNLWESVSLLIAEGHASARNYPLQMVLAEVRIAVVRINHKIATEAILIQTAIASALSEDGARQFSKTVEKLNRR